jgi:magnesium transporter
MLTEYPDETALLVENNDDADSARLLEQTGVNLAVAVLRRLTPDRAARIVVRFAPEFLAEVLPALNPNRTAAMLSRLDDAEQKKCLAAVDSGLAAELRDLAAYPPKTAGAMMDPRVTSFRPEATVRDVISRIKRFRDRRIQDVFLVDTNGMLLGAVALQDVVLADSGTRLESLVRPPASVPAIATAEEVVQTFDTQRVSSLPVVDFEGRLLGVLRQRELIEVAQEQATASAVTMVGASEQERALSSPLFSIRKRLPWLQVNLLTAFLAASVVGLFEGMIAAVPALAVLLPVVAGQSGNTGAQALAVTMRGLALREVRTHHWFRVLVKEAAAGLGNGIAVATVTAVAVYFWSSSLGLASVIGTSMVISMVVAGAAGAAIPMILTALGQDPAQSSSIVLTTVTDVSGFFSFLGIATLLAASL